MIHPTAVVEEGAQIGKDVKIGPYAVVHKDVILDDGVEVKAHVFIDGNTRVGKGSTIWPGAVIGTKTQDLKFQGEKTYIEIGERCDIREYVTVNASCGEGSVVHIGDQCLIMAYCHIAHNSHLGNRVVMANNATLAGHVCIGDCAVIGGLSAIHQFSRVGPYAMVGGMSRVTHDVPPYLIGAGSPFRFGGTNLVGLRRHKFSARTRRALARAFRILYRSGLGLDEALAKIESEVEMLPEVSTFIDFCRSTKRGIIADGRKKD